MAETQPQQEIKEYADGWITERKGTDVPTFLKVAFIVIAGGCLAYFFIYMYGETTHEDRGILVQQFNEVTQSSPALMYIVAALALIYGIIVVSFAWRKFHED
ncbi:MAG: hypothetical protein RMM98_05780 [Acidobacteriota bacterium]|nr:hypothetical protein [Blastocatellia bacterium]MDW8239106.1 hypothetical protein [Acidobacteriota bacterium]